MKIATIGTGGIVDSFIQATTQIEGADVIAVYSRKKETGTAFADTYAIKKVYTDMDDMLHDPSINCIYIAAPNSLHYVYTKQALCAGKHVICEKPFTSTLKELEELITLAKANHVFLFEAIVTIHMPNYRKMKELLPKLGTIRMVQCNFSQYSSKYDAFLAGDTPNVFNPDFSGGALSDINIYNLHFTMNMFGKPKHVQYIPNMQRGIDTSGILILEYPDFHAVCVGCKDTKSHNIAQIQGELGYMTLNSETSKCSSFSITTSEGTQIPSIKQHDIPLYYEIRDFVQIFKSQDYEYCYKLLDYSKSVIEVYEVARASAGIHFPSDDRA